MRSSDWPISNGIFLKQNERRKGKNKITSKIFLNISINWWSNFRLKFAQSYLHDVLARAIVLVATKRQGNNNIAKFARTRSKERTRDGEYISIFNYDPFGGCDPFANQYTSNVSSSIANMNSPMNSTWFASGPYFHFRPCFSFTVVKVATYTTNDFSRKSSSKISSPFFSYTRFPFN